MAIEISSFPFAQPPSTDYPSGDITDAAVGVTPTPVKTTTNGDLQQFFAKIMREANVTPNGLRDNTTNGWQLFESLQRVTNALWESVTLSALAGGTIAFDQCKFITVTNPTASANAIILDETLGINGNEVFVKATCNAGDVLSFVTAGTFTVLTGLASRTMASAGHVYLHIKLLSNSAINPTYTIEIYNDNGLAATWTDATPGTDWALGTPPARFYNTNGNVSIQGQMNISGVSFATIVFILPAGNRPSQSLLFPCVTFETGGGTYGSCVIGVATNGHVTILDYTPPSPVTNGVIDFSSINFNTL